MMKKFLILLISIFLSIMPVSAKTNQTESVKQNNVYGILVDDEGYSETV